jgi:hypothetical protein
MLEIPQEIVSVEQGQKSMGQGKKALKSQGADAHEAGPGLDHVLMESPAQSSMGENKRFTRI